MNIGYYFLGQQEHAFLGSVFTFHPNNLAHLRLSQRSYGEQVSSICRMQLRPSDIVVSPGILSLF